MLPSVILTALIAYLLGSLPFAVIVSKFMGLADPRSFGSGNPGATNVLRTGNKKAAIYTLLGDMLKGVVAVLLAQYAVRYWGLSTGLPGIAALAAFLGHIFPCTLKFKGGKGVATALGVLLALNIWLGLLTAATWLVVFYASRYSSLSALTAAVLSPMYYFLGAGTLWPLNGVIALCLILICALLLWRHSANIRRLIQGTEPKVGQKKEL
ncbi:glycerol-3-phosphate 1-O-acyltransferase PlsY [Paenalcaligenes sp. Me131]|uniref:glycerol-3-phosphate 1-O-acyltransferase PlsY n=1 Tax=Paenalcaligenes sp. Me131 TaxID=3392636 RepID=UPI003D2E2737